MLAYKSKNTYNYLNIVKNYTHLSDSEPVQKFLDLLKGFVVSTGSTIQQLQEEQIKSCFISADSMKQAFLVISLCLGNIQTISNICKFIQSVDDQNTFNQKFLKFNGKGTFLQKFEKNAKQYGSQYPFFRQKVFDHITETQAKQIFQKEKESANLYGLKIRKWPQSYQSKSKQNEIKRTYEQQQSKFGDDSTYLTIFELKEKQKSTFTIGLLYYPLRIYTKLCQNEPKAQQKVQKSESEKDSSIREVEKKETQELLIAKNTKKPTTQFSKNKLSSNYTSQILMQEKIIGPQTFKRQQENILEQNQKESSCGRILKITSWPLMNFFRNKQNE